MIKINGSLISETHIIGVGPIIRTEDFNFKTVKLHFDLYLIHHTVAISTDKWMTMFEDEKMKAGKAFDKFRKEWHALYNALQAGEWEIFKTYCAEVERAAKQ